MSRIYRLGMTTTSGGNVSTRDEKGIIWITPAGIDKGSLSAHDIVAVGRNGQTGGRIRPSTELPFHRMVYEIRDDVRAIIHAHPPGLVAFSLCGQAPDVRCIAHRHWICGEVGFARYERPGSDALGRRIAEVFAQGHDCVILENHGVVVAGCDLTEAFVRFEALEMTAQTILRATRLGRPRRPEQEHQRRIADANSALAQQHRDAAAVDEAEVTARQNICRFLQRGYRQRLFTCADGVLSSRADDNILLITPQVIDRAVIEPFQLVRGEIRAAPNEAHTAAPVHDAIYQQHPDVRAVVQASPVHATAFAITGATLDSRTIPESYIFLRAVQTIPPAMASRGPETIAQSLSPQRPVALVPHAGALVTGRSVLDAFDRLEVLEATAAALLDAKALGNITPLHDAAIRELDEAFPV